MATATRDFTPEAGALFADRHALPVRVYYEDTDFSGFVYHASYLRFFERGRTELLRSLGFHQIALSESVTGALVFVVRRLSVEFLRPARMDDAILVETRVGTLRAAAVELNQTISRREQILTVCDVSILALVDGRPKRIPSALKTAFERLATQGRSAPGP